MSHSNSSLNCFAECQAKYNHSYILHTKPDKPPSEHLVFGSMAHDVLHKAGDLRDASETGIVQIGEYNPVIPSEVLYPDLKTFFGINSWNTYFRSVIKATAAYEKELIQELQKESNDEVCIKREVKLSISPVQAAQLWQIDISEPITGIIDLLLITKTHAYILDYKFSTNRKTQDTFDQDSQLYMYAMLINRLYNIPLHNIKVGYIDIPKREFDRPTLLSSGKLSRDKNQNVSQDIYAAAVKAIHGDDDKFNCEPGGFYYDAWCNFALNKPAYLSMQWLDINAYGYIVDDLLAAAVRIEEMRKHKEQFLRKFGTYSCSSCEYLNSCKPWLAVGNKYGQE